jgi:hypothetical protein
MLRRYSIHIIASKGRFFSAGEQIPDDVTVAGFAERCRLPDEQQPDDERAKPQHQSASSPRIDETLCNCDIVVK